MEYIPNWSFGYDPIISKTGHDTLGMQVKYRRDFTPARTRLVVGADIDHSPGSHEEHSINAVKDSDGIFSSYTVGELIYDYNVTFTGVSPYLHLETSLSEKTRLSAGLRYDSMSYDYDNKLADAPIRVTPTSTGRPLTYNHPGDTTVDFAHVSPKLGATYAFTPALNGFVSYRRAFRAPSEGDLFRPGSTTASLDLDPVKADSYETGVRGRSGNMDYEVSYYYMVKTDDLVAFKDPVTSDQFTTNAGKTLHRGIELSAGTQLSSAWRLDLSYAQSKHTFEDWVEKGVDFGGNEMATAPEEQANLRLGYTTGLLNGGKAEMEWEHLGAYWLDNENTERYSGHDLLNLRANYLVSASVEVYARLMNVADKRYATAASLSRGEQEFAPGMPRTFYAGVSAKF
jgi:outer membrane receptor protein involved in Fe transport